MSVVIDGSSGITTNSGTVVSTTDATLNGLTVGKGGGSVSTNTAVGASALATNSTGTTNTVVGYQAGYTNSTGPHNTFVGTQAGYSSTNGENTCVGRTAGYSISTGTGNTFIGPGNGATSNGSGYYVTTGSLNTIIGGYNGNQGGLDIRTASNYIVLSDGAGNPRAAFNGSGYMMVGDPAYTDARITASENLTSNNGITVKNTVAQTGSQWFMAFRNSANATAGTIAHTGTTTVSYNTSSDVRLKENIADAPTALPIIENINVRSYDWKEDKRHVDFGFVAQELHTHFPEAVFVGDRKSVV